MTNQSGGDAVKASARTAAVVTGGLLILVLALGMLPTGEGDSPAMSVLRPGTDEIVLGLVWVVMLFAVVWALTYLSVRLANRRR